MKVAAWLIKVLIGIVMVIVAYIIIALLLSYIPINHKSNSGNKIKEIYLSTNGIHVDIVISKSDLSTELLKGLHHTPEDKYFSIGWGEENFYLHTPNFSDLTASNALRATFLPSAALMHVTRYKQRRKTWTRVQVSSESLDKLKQYIEASFYRNEEGNKIKLAHAGYYKNDDFYKANGSYTALNNCNSWANRAFKVSGLKSSLWTPFDFGLLHFYEE